MLGLSMAESFRLEMLNPKSKRSRRVVMVIY